VYNEELFDFLAGEQRTDIQLGGVFSLTGLIGPWMVQIAYEYGSEIEYPQEQVGYANVRQAGSWFWYRWYDEGLAKAARKVMAQKYPPSQVWAFTVDTNDVLNLSEEKRPAWGDVIEYTAKMAGPGSKHGHEFNLIALPKSVQALADAHGIENAGYDLNDLGAFDADTDHQTLREYIGGGSVSLEDSILYRRRAALWESLGETNPDATRPKNATFPSGKPDTDKAATSDLLNSLFGIYTITWTKPAFLHMVSVPNPRPDAVYTKSSGEGLQKKRTNIPTIWEIYKDRGQAVESARAIMIGDGGGEEEDIVVQEGPPMPEMFRGYSREWKTTMEGVIAELATEKPLIVVYGDKGGEKLLGCTIEELQAHVEYWQGKTAEPVAAHTEEIPF
jgi:hypothetical protein